ncbi:hypothetical protein DY000_02024173 [Brassica cretica]|uniref:Secreted protein n=1 Tax=Brassica cretica TaxID=69181 RepID=A0ABQ7EB64_BRACR|nr:hypothetical protein DY000_02024173 [Brassica cretica]
MLCALGLLEPPLSSCSIGTPGCGGERFWSTGGFCIDYLVSTWARPELQVSSCVGSVSARAFIHQQCSVYLRFTLSAGCCEDPFVESLVSCPRRHLCAGIMAFGMTRLESDSLLVLRSCSWRVPSHSSWSLGVFVDLGGYHWLSATSQH